MNENSVVESWNKRRGMIAGIITILVLAVFPLSFRHFYLDILKAKYQYYYVGVIVAAVIMIITTLVFVRRDFHYHDGGNVKKIFGIYSIKKMRAVDWAMFAFVLAISTLQSDFLYESFWGNEGRLCGLFLILLYGISYIIIVGSLRYKRVYLDAFLLAGIIAGIIGILQYFPVSSYLSFLSGKMFF